MKTNTVTFTHPSVNVLENRTLHCYRNASYSNVPTTIKVGPFDQLVAPFIPVAVVFIYEQSGSLEPIPVRRLQRVLELLLDYYPHLTGRLNIATDGTYEITRIGTGAELLVAKCTDRLDSFSLDTPGQISLMDLPGASNALFGPFDASLEGICRDPLFTVQHTRFACGSVALGVRLRHNNCDGNGYFQLIRDLAELYRGLKSDIIPTLARPPHFLSYMSDLDMTSDEKQEALAFKPSLLVIDPLPEAITAPSQPPPHVVGRILRFTGAELEALKVYATDPSTPNNWVSTFEAISALLYQSIYQARLQHFSEDPSAMSPPDFLTPLDFRGKRFPELPPAYFPNALLCLYTSLSHDMLSHAPLWQIAKHLHDLMRNKVPDAGHLKNTLRWIAAQPDKTRIRSGFRYGNGSIMVSQWAKFDMYAGTEFDDDEKPKLVSTPFTSISLVDGLAYTLPTEMQGKAGGDKQAIDVNLALSEPIWEILERDEQLKQFSTSWSPIGVRSG
ncbi:transferase family-domain-containing protein [Lentinula aff. detonsa]|uniref:Transferase family-domain-containing protein n=1 Tax=Lentinula aff. detonsa TaxID=2804958 RepID=A0AA38KE15_9AGAR|nr:transferase family-domain-containing protein [Lentinula aff. detonsa]